MQIQARVVPRTLSKNLLESLLALNLRGNREAVHHPRQCPTILRQPTNWDLGSNAASEAARSRSRLSSTKARLRVGILVGVYTCGGLKICFEGLDSYSCGGSKLCCLE